MQAVGQRVLSAQLEERGGAYLKTMVDKMPKLCYFVQKLISA